MMKKWKLFALLVLTLSLLLVACSGAEEGTDQVQASGDTVTLYVYNWGEYISDGSEGTLDVNAEFEKWCRETLGMKVKVNYSTFSSNEDLYAKLSSGAASYDVVIPSDYMIERMVKDNMLRPLNMENIPNYEHINEAFKGENVYYEGEKTGEKAGVIYSVPYFYGMVGVIYNTSVVPETEENIGSWELMWDPDYDREILQFNNSRDAFGTALYKLGYDVNHATEEQWREALEELKEQKKLVQGYVMDEIFNKMKNGSAAIAAYYAGDYLSMYEGYEGEGELGFFYPKEGTNSYVDAMCIPANSKNPTLAEHYINFMCSREIGIANAEYTYYASPLDTVVEDEEYRACMAEVHEDAMNILYGSAQSVPTQAYLNLSPEGLTRLNSLWEELKIESSIGDGIYIGCGVILAALLALVISLIIKKRRWAKLYD